MNELTGTILVVDDDASARDILSRRLAKDGHRVFTASGATDALRILAEETTDLMLLDVNMPEISGFDVLKTIRTERSLTDLPVIMVTGRDESNDVITGLNLGANDYVTKPVSMPVVLARVRTQMKLRKTVTALEKVNRILSELALVDGLTSIANRRCFDETLEREWRAGERTQAPLSLVMIDVDHFKRFNDTYGHEMGDEVLRTVAGALQRFARRATDLVARYGGEEFGVVLPNTNLGPAIRLAENMRNAVAESRLHSSESEEPVRVTMSAGVASAVPSRSGTPSDLLRAADTLLYQAKRDGRNRVAAIES